jgi:hypothetical protein
MCRVQRQGFALSFIVIMSSGLRALGTVEW